MIYIEDEEFPEFEIFEEEIPFQKQVLAKSTIDTLLNLIDRDKLQDTSFYEGVWYLYMKEFDLRDTYNTLLKYLREYEVQNVFVELDSGHIRIGSE